MFKKTSNLGNLMNGSEVRIDAEAGNVELKSFNAAFGIIVGIGEVEAAVEEWKGIVKAERKYKIELTGEDILALYYESGCVEEIVNKVQKQAEEQGFKDE